MTSADRIDTMLVNGSVWTGDIASTWASAVAIGDGVVVAVGSGDDITELAGGRAETVDLAGRMVVPGFVDAHVHPIQAGQEMLRCDLSGARTLPEYLDVVSTYAEQQPDDTWIRGGGWSFDAFPGGVPSAEDLDRVVGGRPAALYNRDRHTLWVSSEALRRAGIDRDTPDPADGRIERSTSGHPVGALQEGAMSLVERILPAVTAADLREALLVAQTYLHSLGITGWQDAKTHPPFVNTYTGLADEGLLTGTVVCAQWWDRAGDIDQLDRMLDVRRTMARPGLRFDATKVMLDGVCENFTAAVLEPYVHLPAGAHTDYGIGFFERDVLFRCVAALDAAGQQVHFHAVGDAAARQALDAVEYARATNGDSGPRHHVAHLQIVHPDDIPRFRQLRVAANVQPLWARNEPQMTELTVPHLGERRTGWQYPFGALHRAGAVVGMGSDWPVSTPNPIRELHVAVNRTPAPDRTSWTPADGVFLPEERLSLATALRSFTAGSAWINGVESTAGSLEPGKRADLIVLDRNLFDHPPEAIWEAQVDQTWVGGVAVHTR